MAELAVLTGDIVKSTQLPDGALEAIFDGLAQAADALAQWSDVDPCLTRARGDGWQVVAPAPLALRAALALRAGVRLTGKDHDTRIGIALGTATLPGPDLSAASGPAFVASGHALDTMARRVRMAASGPVALTTALPLADHIAQGWTVRQAQIALATLPPDAPTQEALAQHFAIAQQSLQDIQSAAGLPALTLACAAFEAG